MPMTKSVPSKSGDLSHRSGNNPTRGGAYHQVHPYPEGELQ